jgi:hypothetical protein
VPADGFLFRNGLLKSERYNLIGHIRDGLIISAVVGAGIYFLEHAEKLDAFLDWMLGRR